MRYLSLLILLFGLQGYAADQKTIKSSIKQVTVYQQGAQIQRKGSFSVNKGISEIKISGVSPYIDANTLQIKAFGKVVILDSKHNVRYPEPETAPQPVEIPTHILRKITAIEDSLFDLSYEMSALQNQIDVLNNEKRIIQNNGTIKGVGKVNDSIPLLKDALTYYHEKMNQINTSLLQLDRSRVLLSRKQSQMNTRLSQLKNYQAHVQPPSTSTGPVHEIIVTLSSKEATSGRIEVTYMVNNAGWTPLYDLRSNNTKKTIDLTYKAQVYQQTGIDWSNVRLSLSTNNPYANKTKPELHPWYLDYQSVNRYSELEKKRDIVQKNRPKSIELSSVDSAEDDQEVEFEEALTADHFMTTVEQLVSVAYAIDLPYTIKSDNKKNMVLIKNSSLPANYRYHTVPKLDLSVYLVAQITNLDELNLIPGRATIFHDGAYLGATYLNTGTLDDTLNLSLGKTSNITVKRTLLKHASKEKIVGDKITKTYAYRISVRNHSKQTLPLVIEDQMPVTRDPEIEITPEELSKGKLNEIYGQVIWDQKLKPLGQNDYELVYTIKYAKGKPINLAGL